MWTCGHTFIFIGGQDGVMILYHIANKRMLHRYVHSQPVVIDDSKKSADTSIAPENRENEDDEDEEEEPEELEACLSVECVGFSSDDFKWVASGGMDKTLKIWDISSGSCRCVCMYVIYVIMSW